MNRRFLATVVTTAASIGLILPSLASPAAAQPLRASDDVPSTLVTWCDAPSSPPCIDSASDNGTAVTSGSSDWSVSGGFFTLDGATQINWGVGAVPNPPGGYESMGDSEAGHEWTITFDLGDAFIPRVTSTYADDVDIVRVPGAGGTYTVTVTGKVVTMGVNDECHATTPVTCPDEAGQDITAFQGNISDFEQWSDSSQWPDFYGLDAWTNVEETDIPPEISGDPLQITAPLTNSRELATGDVFKGFYHVILPNPFLQDMGIDDPSTLSADGLSTSLGDGAGSIAVTPGDTSTEVDATGIVFPVGTDPAHFRGAHHTARSTAAHHSKKSRVLRVKRGTITPTRPSKLHTHRASAHRGHVSFHHAKPRGSRIKGYQVSCAAHGHPTRHGFGKHSPVVAKGLAKGVRYSCRVRAKSKAGYGHWSPHRTLAAH